jgi:metal-sulfur cluster biosynthetic enzyme
MTVSAPNDARTAALEAAVRSALAQVRDPELDQPVTDLGFVAGCRVTPAGDVSVRLRLPTYFCAPNFAYLMVADAYDAVAGTPGVRGVEVELIDHFAADAINQGVAARSGFVASFAGHAQSELDGLRADFLRKAVLAGTDRVCRPMLAAGRTAAELAGLTLGDAPATPERERLRAQRRELGLPAADDSPLMIDPSTGVAVAADAVPLQLRRIRLTRVSVDANAEVCRGLLRERYGER